MYVLIAFLTFTGIFFLASFMRSWEERERYPDEPLYTVRESELCQEFHSWEQAAFLSYEEMAEVRKDPMYMHAKKVPFCKTCGYVPTLEKMVKPIALKNLNEQFETAAKLQAKAAKIDGLAEDFYHRIIDGAELNPTELVVFRAGFQAYKAFVDALPHLLAEAEVNELENEDT